MGEQPQLSVTSTRQRRAVRSTGYNQAIGTYQGELVGQTRYMRAFLGQG